MSVTGVAEVGPFWQGFFVDLVMVFNLWEVKLRHMQLQMLFRHSHLSAHFGAYLSLENTEDHRDGHIFCLLACYSCLLWLLAFLWLLQGTANEPETRWSFCGSFISD